MALAVLSILSACSEGPIVPFAWEGTGQTTSVTYALELIYTKYGDHISGQYYIDDDEDPTGKVEGTIRDGVVRMVLSRSTTVSWDFVGTVTDARLHGTFVPRSGATRSGEWELYRR